MPFAFSQIVSELDAGRWKPFYLAVGEEPFQMTELFERLKGFFIPNETARTFNYEAFDGEHHSSPSPR